MANTTTSNITEEEPSSSSSKQQQQQAQQQAPAGLGSNPPIWRYKISSDDVDDNDDDGDGNDDDGLPVPWWFNSHSANLYHTLPLYDDDIIISSGVKMGTTWVNKLLVSLLYEYDDNGNLIPEEVINRDHYPGRHGQTYPDALYPNREMKADDTLGIDGRMPQGGGVMGGKKGGGKGGGGQAKLDVVFGNFTFEDVVNQPRPRMISSHLFGRKYLPRELFDGYDDDSDEQCCHDDGDGSTTDDKHYESSQKGSDDSHNNYNTSNTTLKKSTKRRKGKGRLIIVLRNLKDTLVSLHNFRGTPMDGWLGNAHGPGSFRRFINVDNCPNAMGSAFLWVKENAMAVEAINNNHYNKTSNCGSGYCSDEIGREQRALVVYYESLITNFTAQLYRINAFLSLPPLSSAKALAISEACTFTKMLNSKSRTSINCRKGGMYGWKDVMELRDEIEWKEFDSVFEKVLGGVDVAEPMRFFHGRVVDGMPPLKMLTAMTFNKNDGGGSSGGGDGFASTGEWPPYRLVMLKEGMIVTDPYVLNKDQRQPSSSSTTYLGQCSTSQQQQQQQPTTTTIKFDDTNNKNDGAPRYHLFVSTSCPKSIPVIAARTILGMEHVLGMDVSEGQSSAGWVFLNGANCAPWKDNGRDYDGSSSSSSRDGDDNSATPFWLYQAYQLSNPLCTTQIHLPVLWDTVTQTIVSNNAWEIIQLMSEDASRTDMTIWNDALGVIPKEGLFPSELKDQIERMYRKVQNDLIGPVESVGMEYLRKKHHDCDNDVGELQKNFFDTLDELEVLLGQKRFVTGNHVTAVDIHLSTFLFCLDACYWDIYYLRNAPQYKGPVAIGKGYPNLKAFCREMYLLLKPNINLVELRRQCLRLARSIEYTQQSYSCITEKDDAKSCTTSNNGMDNEQIILPTLDEIVASLEEPAGERPVSSTVKQSNASSTTTTSPNPMKMCEGVPMPPFFRQDAWEIFRNMDLREDDIILSSGVKMGTSWVTKILNGLLYDFDRNGNPTDVYMDDKFPNRLGQTYPEAMPPTREIEQQEMAEGKGVVEARERIKQAFGDFTVDELIGQPSPRLFSSHLFGQKLLPKELFDGWGEEDKGNENNDGGISLSNGHSHCNKGKGRLIIVVRNLKDSLVSLHHFRGVPKDGWYGNEHGPGSFRRWIDLKSCPNAYGNAFQWVKTSADAVDAIGPERALVIYYEALKSNFDAQLHRINDFLDLPRLTEAKQRAIREECSAEKMKSNATFRFKKIIRKGSVGDWTNYLEEKHWKEIDRTFNEVLNGVALAEPLRLFQFRDVPGMPPLSLRECNLDTDPRSWPPYLLVTLKEGMIVPEPRCQNIYCIANESLQTQFKSTIRPGRYLRMDETGKDRSPRFHLFVAGSCPLASSVAAARTLLGLERLISMDISDGQSGAGWVFLNGTTCSPWKEREGPFWLYETYQLADPFCTTSISIPLLWDTETQKIVSNDSWEIMKLMSDAASDLGLCSAPKEVQSVIAMEGDRSVIPTLFPDNLKENIEQMFKTKVKPLLDIVLRNGFELWGNSSTDTRLMERQNKLFTLLEVLEELMGKQHYLLGNKLTGADVVLTSCLLQFDACYWNLLKSRGSERYRGNILTSDSYPNLKAYTRCMYQFMKKSVYFESFRQVFRVGQAMEFTRMSYACTETDKKAMEFDNEDLSPDLGSIIAALESPC